MPDYDLSTIAQRPADLAVFGAAVVAAGGAAATDVQALGTYAPIPGIIPSSGFYSTTGAVTASTANQRMSVSRASVPSGIIGVEGATFGPAGALIRWQRADGTVYTPPELVGKGSLTVFPRADYAFPADAVRALISSRTLEKSPFNVTAKSLSGATLTDRLAATDNLLQIYEPIPFGAVLQNTYYDYQTGVATATGNDRRATPLVAVSPGETLQIPGVVAAAATQSALIVMFNAVGAYVDFAIRGTSVDQIYSDEVPYLFTVPAGVAFIGVTNSGADPVIKRNSIAAAKRLTPALDYWRGKRILWSGESQAAVAPQGGVTYPAAVASALAATVDNRSVATSMTRAGVASIASGAVIVGSIASGVLTVASVLRGTVQAGAALSPAFVTAGVTINAQTGGTTGGVGTYSLNGSPADVPAGTTIFIGTDPLGWTGVLYDRVARSLVHTVGEKQELILNYAKWRPLLKTAPASLSAAAQTDIIGYSFENRILPQLATADVLVLDRGGNGYSAAIDVGASDLLAVPFDSRDRSTEIGAINWLIDRVQSTRDAAGLAPILLAFKGYHESHSRPDIAPMQTGISALWNMPFLRLWDRLGWSQQQLVTTGDWVGTDPNFTWTPNQVAARSISYLGRALPDGLHPYKDSSGRANAKMVGLMVPWLRDFAR